MPSDSLIDFAPFSEHPKSGFVVQKLSTGVLFPNAPDTIDKVVCVMADNPDPNKISKRDWDGDLQEQFFKGDIYIDFHGEITYEDSTGRPHWTRFCEAINGAPFKKPEIQTMCIDYESIDKAEE